jgi:hypothetical protein
MDLSELIEQYLAAAETMGNRIRETQRSAAAANSFAIQILKNPDFKKMPLEMQEKFRSSQVSAAEILKSFEGFQ